MQKVVIITGASSGIGYATARLLAQSGCKVYALARRLEKMQPLKQYGVYPIAADVTDQHQLESAINTVLRRSGRIDVLFNNAGYGSFGAIEDVPIAEAQSQFDVNLFGLARITKLVLPIRLLPVTTVSREWSVNERVWMRLSSASSFSLS